MTSEGNIYQGTIDAGGLAGVQVLVITIQDDDGDAGTHKSNRLRVQMHTACVMTLKLLKMEVCLA